MKDVQCYEIFGGIALKNHAFSFKSRLVKVTSLVRIVISLYYAAFYTCKRLCVHIPVEVSAKYPKKKCLFKWIIED